MKTVLFVPGYQEDMESRDYTSTLTMVRNQGYEVVFVPINWERTTIDDWVSELMATYGKLDAENTILAGFSFGAMTAFMAATIKNPSELWLFSLAPYFHDDIQSKHMYGSWLRTLGHRRVSAFEKLDYKALASKVRCKTLLFAGDIEMKKWAVMKSMTNEAPKHLAHNKLTIIEGVGHDVANPKYIAAIKSLI